MAGKKIWAFAKNKRTQKYVAGTEHKHKLYFIWEALKLKRENESAFNDLEFVSTQRLEKNRREMHTNIGGYFRYNPNHAPKSPSDPDSDSLSHSLAIAALAEMKTLNFNCNGETFSITPTSVETEQRLRLISEGQYKYYVPDIIYTFAHDSVYAKRWGRKLVVEVMHTHACEDVKIRDFENHSIPIIEVKLNSMTLEERTGTKSPNIQQIEDFYNYIKGIFSNVIYGTILSNPVTADFYRENVTVAFEKQHLAEKSREEARSEVNRLKPVEESLNKLTEEYAEFKKKAFSKINAQKEDLEGNDAEIVELKKQLNDVKSTLDQSQRQLKSTQGELKEERGKTLWDRLFKD